MMSTLNEIEARLARLEKRSERAHDNVLDSIREVAQFQERVTRATSIAAAIAGAIALLYAIKHWLYLGGWWPQAFSVGIGVLIYGLLASWLDRWRVAEPPVRRRRKKPRQQGESDARTANPHGAQPGE